MDWLDLLAVQGTLKSLPQHHTSKASILQCSAYFIVQLSHPYMTTGKTIALTRQTSVGKVMSLLLNMLSRLVITSSKEQASFNFMAAITISSDFGTPKNKVSHSFHWECHGECHEQYERQKDMTLKDELPRLVDAQYATGEEWRNSFRKNEEAGPKQKQCPVIDVTGDGSKVRWCKEQYRTGIWNVRSMNQGKLEVVKQEMARVNINVLGISELKWTGMGEFNSDEHYIYYCG